MASNFKKLDYFAYLMEYSCLKTLAAKYKSTIAKIIHAHQDGRGKWCIPYQTKRGEKRLYFAKFSDCKEVNTFSDNIHKNAIFYSNSINTFEVRLKAKICELCGSMEAERYEIHHIKRLKDLKGKAHWVKADYFHIITQTTSGGKAVTMGGKACVLLGKKASNKIGLIGPGINTWIDKDNLTTP